MDEESGDPIPVWPWLIGSISALGFFTFAFGWHAIDSPSPSEGAAFPWYLMTVMLGAASLVSAIVTRSAGNGPVLFGSVAAAFIGISLAGVAETEYNSLGIQFYYVIFLFPAILLGYGITMLVLGLRNGKRGLADACVAWGIAMGAGAGGAALYHMLTISRQAELSRTAHESPFGMVAVAMALLGVLALRSK